MAKIIRLHDPILPLLPHGQRAAAQEGRHSFEEIDVSQRELRAQMSAKAGGRHTVPQIWIGDRHVGGCDDLYALDREGKLDLLLAA